MFVFRIKLFSDVISKTFVYKIAWYHEVFQIIAHQPSGTNLLFLQSYLRSIASNRTYLNFGFSDLEREEKTDMAEKVIQPIIALNVLRSLELRSLLVEKNLAYKLICVYVIQWLWSLPSSFFVNFVCSCDRSLQSIMYAFMFFSFFTWKTKAMSSRWTFIRINRVFFSQHIFGCFAVLA